MTALEQAVFNLVQHNMTEPASDSTAWDEWNAKQGELVQAVWNARLAELSAQMESDFPGKLGADF